MAEVNRKVEDWLEEVKQLAAVSGRSLREEGMHFLNKELQREVTAYYSPDGKVRITDGHHKVSSALKLMRRLRIPIEEVDFSVDLKEDFRGKSWKKYVKWREKNDPTYIPEDVRKNFSKRQISEFYQSLPKRFPIRKDLPMRSALGFIFEKLSLEGGDFVAALQFKLGERLGELGIQVKAGEEFSTKTQIEIERAMFSGEHSEEIRDFLIDKALPKKREETKAILKRARKLAANSLPLPFLKSVSEAEKAFTNVDSTGQNKQIKRMPCKEDFRGLPAAAGN